MHRVKRFFWFIVAALFLIEAWLWDKLGAALRVLVALVPLAPLKAALRRLVAVLPVPVVLLVFLLPLAVIEPCKLLALALMAHHHVVLGALVFVALKFFGLGLISFLFDATREKLLSMPWFARFYAVMLRVRARAHAFVAPYKDALRARLRPLKARLAALAARWRGQGGFSRHLAVLRARLRRRAASQRSS